MERPLELKLKRKPINEKERKKGWVDETGLYYCYRKICGVILFLNTK